jgi:regulator of RNase E activity RraA
MKSDRLHRTYLDLSTPHVADACMRLGIPIRCAQAAARPLWPGTHFAGLAFPSRHYGSVDIFLEAIDRAEPGDVLVVDNGGRDDEACDSRG